MGGTANGLGVYAAGFKRNDVTTVFSLNGVDACLASHDGASRELHRGCRIVAEKLT